MPDRPPQPARASQPPGKTYLRFSPDGKRMAVAGCANYARSYKTNDLGEPDMVNDTHEDTLAVVCGNDYMILGCEDGTVCEYQVPEGNLNGILVRFSLPVRSIALSPDEKWIAVSGDEIAIKIVNRHDIEQIHVLRDHPKPIKHLTYDPSGKYLTASCTNGNIYVYQTDRAEPELLRTIEGVIGRIEPVEEASSACVWHPDGRAFACATPVREVVVVSIEDGAQQRTFTGGHDGDITALAWSPNGALLATAGRDDKLIFWETKTQTIVRQHNFEKILDVGFHPLGINEFNWTTSWGECFICPKMLNTERLMDLLSGPKVSAPFYHDPRDERSVALNGRRALPHGRGRTPDSLDEMLGPAPEEEYDWIDDDDGAGYTNGNGKRPNGHLGMPNGHVEKKGRQAEWQPQIHESFQPGATPWRGNRKYLCLNLIGFVWTVDQDTHHTVTVEFYDRGRFRDFHFSDQFMYDKACLNERGTLFACPPNDGQSAILFYRPHETWTNRTDIRISLPDGEEATSIALSKRYVIATTSANFVRVWTLFGTPLKIWRMKSSPGVTCAAHGDYVMTVSNGPVAADGCTLLTYSIDDLRRDETCQSEDVLPLGTLAPDSVEPSTILTNLFWSDNGNPCIYDSTGILFVLQHWRTPGQAKWVPLLDTKQLERLRSGKKEETYWPVAVADDKFHCIILKGGDKYPYFPRPLLTEFDLSIPVGRKPALPGPDEAESEESTVQASYRLEELFVRRSILTSLFEDQISHLSASSPDHRPTHSQRSELARQELEIDKTLLQLLAVEAREGEDKGMKALEVVKLIRDKTGRMIEAAGKVAGRWERTVLEGKIREVGERRLAGLQDDDDDEDDVYRNSNGNYDHFD